jgi:hypothetical protein
MTMNVENRILVDAAYKLLCEAKEGNAVSLTKFNEFAKENGLCLYSPETPYNGIASYDEFYNIVYYSTMLD